MLSKTKRNSIQQHLTSSLCNCKICHEQKQKPNPQIFIDELYQMLKSSENQKTSANSNLYTKNIKSHSKISKSITGFDWYLKTLVSKSKTLPNFPILDTIIMENGQMLFYLFHQSQQNKLHLNSLLYNQSVKPILGQIAHYPLTSLKQTFLNNKMNNDIDYLKTKHKQANPRFQWAQLDHESQKLIKQFEKKLKFTDAFTNKVAIIKQNPKSYDLKNPQSKNKDTIKSTQNTSSSNQEKILSRLEFTDLFNRNRVKICQLTDINFIQIFPVLQGYEERSKTKQIKYFKHLQVQKALFKEAQNYVIAWMEKNQSLQKMQEHFINSYFYKKQNLRILPQFPQTSMKRLTPQSENEFLTYISYKILLHFQMQTNIEIKQCLLEFMTVDDGASYSLKNIDFIKYEEKPQVVIKQNKLPKYKHIDRQDYVDDMRKSMRQIFENVQDNFHRLNRDWEAYELKTINDRKESDRVFKTGRELKMEAQQRSVKLHSQFQSSLQTPADSLSRFESFTPPQFSERFKKVNVPDLHQILRSNNKRYKQEMLGLGKSSKSRSNFKSQSDGLYKF